MLQKIFYFFFKLITNLYFLFFLNGLLLASVFYFRMEDTYEKDLFNALSHRIIVDDSIAKNNKDTFFVKAMQLANSLQQNRQTIFGGATFSGLKSTLFHSATDDLLTGQGACGSASTILARILKSYNYKIRLAQMKVGNIWGGHIVTEVKKEEGWIVLDPIFKCFFKKPDGTLASFKDVHENWNYYKLQVPAGYDLNYDYDDARYTNWGKLKLIGPIIRKAIALFYGNEKANEFSLRSYVLRNYHTLYLIALILYIPVLLLTIFKCRKKWLLAKYTKAV